MIELRNFRDSDAEMFREKHSKHRSIDEIRDLFRKWNEKEYKEKYFEMFAIVKNEEMVGCISLYQHSENVISCGPEIFDAYQRQGVAKEAMSLTMDIAKSKGYKVSNDNYRDSQHRRKNNALCIAVKAGNNNRENQHCYNVIREYTVKNA